MMLPQKDARSIQDAIDLKRRVAQASRAPRRVVRTPWRSGTHVPMLFLVKSDTPTPGDLSAAQTPKTALLERDVQKSGSGNLVEMRLKPTPKEKERLLGTMAALGPLLWLGHVLLTWLKIL